jgi:catalase
MRYQFSDATAPTYAPNSYGGPVGDPVRAGEGSWETDGALVRAAQTLHSEDDDFGQAGTLYRDVFDAASKKRFLGTLVGQYNSLTVDRIKERFLWYWTSVDAGLGAKLRSELGTDAPNPSAEPVGLGS